MTFRTDKQRTIEARLDRLRKRSDTHPVSTLKGVIDLLRDVLLADEPEPPPMTQERAEALTKRAT